MIKPHKPSNSGDRPTKSLFAYIWRMSGRHQIWVSVLALLVAALNMAPIELQRRIIDNAISDKDWHLLTILAAIYGATLLLHGIAKFILRMAQGWLSESSIRHNREHLAQFHEEHAANSAHNEDGKVVSIVGPEIDKLGGFVGESISRPVVNLGMLVFGLGYMLAVAPLIGVIGLVALIPQAFLVPLIQKRINRLIAQRVATMREVSNELTELPHNNIDVQQTRLPDRLDLLYRNRMKTFALKYGMKALLNLLNAASPLIVMLVGGYLVIEGQTTVGVIVAFISGFDRLADPVREMLSYYRAAAQAGVQHHMIAKWLRPGTRD
jgi:ABC-type multidrug transport system fused ATPase/permease subunit